jgi:Immunity protein 27
MEPFSLPLKPEETDLVGNWVDDDGRLVSDTIDVRIGWLITNHLQRIALNPQSGAWETLYLDPRDGRYWELTFPRGEMHGGGPRRLTNLPREAAISKYGLGDAQG